MAGSRASDPRVLVRLDYAVEHLHVKEIATVGRTDCGEVIGRDGRQGPAEALGRYEGYQEAKHRRATNQQNEVNAIAERNFELQEWQVENNSVLTGHEVTEGMMSVIGAMYDLRTRMGEFVQDYEVSRSKGVRSEMGETETHGELSNRWIRVIGAVMIQLVLGTIYAWSIFNKPLASYLAAAPGLAPKSLQVLGIFATSLAAFGLFVSVGGILQDRYGPRKIAMVAGVIYAFTYLMLSAVYMSLPLTYVAYAFLGVGVGIGYSCPLACCLKWFPDKRGLISGIAVAGFGAGTFIFAQVGTALFGPSNAASTAHAYPGLAMAYLVLAVMFLVIVIIGSLLLCDPPSNYCPAGWTPPLQGVGSTAKKQVDWREMIRTKTFWMIWTMFVLSAASSLKEFAKGSLDSCGNTVTMRAGSVALLAGTYAIFNGTGRIAWGFISDRKGRTQAMRTMFLVQAIGLFASAAFVLSKPSDQSLQFLMIAVFDSWIGFCFGGNFALFPPITSEYFGTRYFGFNYGLVYTSYAVGGVIGGLMPGIVNGGFGWVFIVTGTGSIAAFTIACFTRPPIVKEERPASS